MLYVQLFSINKIIPPKHPLKLSCATYHPSHNLFIHSFSHLSIPPLINLFVHSTNHTFCTPWKTYEIIRYRMTARLTLGIFWVKQSDLLDVVVPVQSQLSQMWSSPIFCVIKRFEYIWDQLPCKPEPLSIITNQSDQVPFCLLFRVCIMSGASQNTRCYKLMQVHVPLLW